MCRNNKKMGKPVLNIRESFGLEPAPKETFVEIKYMAGCKWYIWWESCPLSDDEDVLASEFGTKKKAEAYAESQGWFIYYGT